MPLPPAPGPGFGLGPCPCPCPCPFLPAVAFPLLLAYPPCRLPLNPSSHRCLRRPLPHIRLCNSACCHLPPCRPPSQEHLTSLEESLACRTADIMELQRLQMVARSSSGSDQCLSWVTAQDAKVVLSSAFQAAVLQRSRLLEMKGELTRLQSELHWRDRLLYAVEAGLLASPAESSGTMARLTSRRASRSNPVTPSQLSAHAEESPSTGSPPGSILAEVSVSREHHPPHPPMQASTTSIHSSNSFLRASFGAACLPFLSSSLP